MAYKVDLRGEGVRESEGKANNAKQPQILWQEWESVFLLRLTSVISCSEKNYVNLVRSVFVFITCFATAL